MEYQIQTITGRLEVLMILSRLESAREYAAMYRKQGRSVVIVKCEVVEGEQG